MELPPKTLLQNGKYSIVEKIGQGGFGIAYRAYHVGLQTEICIKEFFYSDLCERDSNSSYVKVISTAAEKISLVESLQKKFTKEAQRLASFKHPNIVQVTDNFEENNTAYFVMELLEGGSLDELLKRNGAMSEQKAKTLILPIIDALEALHEVDLLHLDIKPANIMLRQNLTPVLIDFGISKYLETTGINTTTAPIGISKGFTPLEQYGGSISDFSKATDIYSLCATIYTMVTGLTPPEPLQMINSGFKSPRDLQPALSPEFNTAILKGLSTKAVDRQQSMTQLKKTVERRQGRIHEYVHPALTYAKVLLITGLLIVLNVFLVANTSLQLDTNNFSFSYGNLVLFKIYPHFKLTTTIWTRDFTSIVLFLSIVSQWLIAMMLAFNIFGRWSAIFASNKFKYYRYFANVNLYFTLTLSILFFVYICYSGYFSQVKMFVGTANIRWYSIFIGQIEWISFVFLLTSLIALVKLWLRNNITKNKVSISLNTPTE